MNSTLNGRFWRHYAEMIAVMFAGMAVLGLPAGLALDAAGSGWDDLRADAPALMLTLMAATMTIPMVPWMRLRGHGWRAANEMALSMIVPTIGVIGLLAAGLVTGIGALLIIEHAAMFAGMFAVMAARPEEYSQHNHGGLEAAAA